MTDTLLTQISVSDTALKIDGFVTFEPAVVHHFFEIQSELRAKELDRALLIGATCLTKAQLAKDLDFVNMRVDKMMFDFENSLNSLPDVLAAKLDVQDGGVLFPVAQLVKDVKQDLSDSLNGVRSTIDPANPASALALAIAKISSLLDPTRTDSVQHKVQQIVQKIAAQDGDLAKSMGVIVNDSVSAAVRPLRERIAEMEKQLIDEKRVAEILQTQPRKGLLFEDDLHDSLAVIGGRIGAEVLRVGGDNKPGDFLINFRRNGLAAIDLNVVVEAKDLKTPQGALPISKSIRAAMSHRNAEVGIYVVKNPATLAKEVGDFHFGESDRGPFFACSAENLPFVVSFALCVMRQRLQCGEDSVDEASLKMQIDAIRTAMKKFHSLKMKVTDITNTAEAMREELRKLQLEIADSVGAMETALKESPQAA